MASFDTVTSAPTPAGNMGTFPRNLGSVTAAILARLLEGEELTPMDSVFRDGTTRLGAFIYSLVHHHNWELEYRDKAVGTKDGRIAHVRAFRLNCSVIEAANVIGATVWVVKVKLARAKLREAAGEVKAIVARRDVSKRWKRHGDSSQLKLWNDE
jgi:hypothetical protein